MLRYFGLVLSIGCQPRACVRIHLIGERERERADELERDRDDHIFMGSYMCMNYIGPTLQRLFPIHCLHIRCVGFH